MKYKDKHLVKIKDFIDYIKINAPVETTVKYITKEFFNGNKEFYQDSVNKLKSAGVLMTNNSYCKGKGQKWYYIENDVDINKLFNVPVNQVPVNQVPVNQVPVNQVPVNQVPVNQVPVVEIITTDYGHFIIEKPTHYDIFKTCLKLTKSTFGSVWKEAVIQECCINGLNNDQAEYIWQKYVEHSKQNQKANI